MGVLGLENIPQGVFSVVSAAPLLPPSDLAAVALAPSLSSRTTGYLDVHSCR